MFFCFLFFFSPSLSGLEWIYKVLACVSRIRMKEIPIMVTEFIKYYLRIHVTRTVARKG